MSESVPDSTKATDTEGGAANTEVAEDKAKNIEDTEKKVNIVLDGPLSQIYTQALNVAYANEGTDDMIANVISSVSNDSGYAYVDKRADDDRPIESEDVYVYATSNEALEEHGCNSAIGHITKIAKKQGKRAVLVIEHHGKVGGTMGLLDAYANDIGMTVCYSRSAAIEAVQRFTKK